MAAQKRICTFEQILGAIMRTPTETITLWHFESIESPAHLNSMQKVNETCRGVGNGVLEFAAHYWKLDIDREQGVVTLSPLPEDWKPEEARPKNSKDHKAAWLAGLYQHGWVRKEAPVPVVHNPHQHIATEYDFSERIEGE